jgi:hypothetical protein
MSQEIEQFETHMDRMERERQAQQAALLVEQERTKRAKIESKKNRQESWQLFVIGFFASAVVLGITAAIFFGVRGPSAEEQQKQEQIMACYDQGKDWVPEQSTGADGVVIVEAHCETSEDK